MRTPSEIINDKRLADILRCSEDLLPFLISHSDDVRQKRIPKKNKKLGFRVVYKSTHDNPIKAFKFYLNELYNPLSCVHGFVPEKNIATNAAVHLSQKYVLNIDIENFFESISDIDVCKAFEQLGFIPTIAQKLAKISTYKGRLVAGFPTSPTIANIVCIDMDKALMTFCETNGLLYTRYADDISISGDVINVLEKIETIINSFGFNLNNKKTRLFKKGQSQYVTGLTISDPLYPRVPRRFKNKIRQKLYYMHKYGIFSYIEHMCSYYDTNELIYNCQKELRSIKGWIDFVHSIEPLLAHKYYQQYNEIYMHYNANLYEYMEREIVNNHHLLHLKF